MQRTMQADCAVFRTEKTLGEGVAKIDEIYKLMADVRVTDRSLIWNSDLVETLELDNMLGPGGRHHALRRQPQGKPRRAHA
jgi:succinate dehydrogenase / fumarate reductase flavoprotein subunit